MHVSTGALRPGIPAVQVAETAVQFFITGDRPNVAGLVLAGSAEFKSELSESDMFDQRLKAAVLAVVDVSYGESVLAASQQRDAFVTIAASCLMRHPHGGSQLLNAAYTVLRYLAILAWGHSEGCLVFGGDEGGPMPVTIQMADCLQVARMASIRPLSSARTHCQTSSLSWKSGSSQSACPMSLLADYVQNLGLCASAPCRSICLLVLCAGVRL